MAIWGNSQNGYQKPAFMTDAEKGRLYAGPHGWTYDHGKGRTEIMYVKKDLNKLVPPAVIDDVHFVKSTVTKGSANGTVMVSFNKKVTVTGVPTIAISGSNTNATASYVSGSGRSQLTFTFAVPNTAQTLTIAPQTLGGSNVSIKETDANTVVASSSIVATAIKSPRNTKGNSSGNSAIVLS